MSAVTTEALDIGRLQRALGGDAVRETHTAWVVLAGDRAYKVKKPVRFAFADLSTADLRHAACAREAALNEELAPGLVLGVRAIVADGDGYTLAADGDPGAVDHCVVMRRFDEARTLAALIARDTVPPGLAQRVGARIAAFHRDARRVVPAGDVQAVVTENLDELLPLADPVVDRTVLLALHRFADAFLLAHDAVLTARTMAGHVVDGHGDLRADHVVDEGDALLLVDRLDLDDLRCVDVADDLAFLVMDLEHRGRADLAEQVLTGYRATAGHLPPRRLLAFFAFHRALVRAKVALIGDDAAEARRSIALARRLAWRARGPVTLLVTGPPASGKSTLARTLADASGLPVLSSDVVRKAASARPDYALEARAAVYRELGRRVAAEDAVIADATFGSRQLQRAFREGLGVQDDRTVLAVECVLDPVLRDARALARQAAGTDVSDAGPAVAAQLAARFTPVLTDRPEDRIALDTAAPVDQLVDAVESWLDTRLASDAS